MTRKRLVAYHALLFTGMIGTLLVTAPPLAALPLGFGVVYTALAAVALLMGWLSGLRGAWWRIAGWVAMVLVSFAVLGLLGGPAAGLAAMALAVWTYWPRKMEVQA